MPTVKVKDAEIYYEAYGQGQPFIFFSETACDGQIWKLFQVPEFAKDHTVIIHDYRGTGRSSKPSIDYTTGMFADDAIAVLDELKVKDAIVLGHSMGGLVVQKYLERGEVPAAVLLASVPPQGLMSSAVGLMFKKPHLLADLNNILNGSDVDVDSLREALFHQPVEPARLQRYYRRCQPESHRAIWDMTLFNLPNPSRMHRPPLLILGARHDHLIPPDQVHMTAATYGGEAEILDGLGHGMMLEQDWERVAQRIAAWLRERRL